MCANLANPAPAGAAHGCGPAAAGMSAEHRPLPSAHDRGLVVGMSAEHGPPPVARGGDAALDAALDAAPGLSTEHGPRRAPRGHGLAVAAAPGLSTGHRPLRAARGRGPAAAARLRWTCGPDSSVGGQLQTAYSWRRRSQQPQR